MAKKSKQLSLIPTSSLTPMKSFGGDLNSGQRKVARPISIKRPMHLVLKSSRARGRFCFLNHRGDLDQSLKRVSQKWGVRVMDRVWVRNHIHMVVQVSSRTQYRSWIRELTGALVKVLSARTREVLRSFFDLRPWTRILDWGRDLRNAFDYLKLNRMEVVGLRPYESRLSQRIRDKLGKSIL